MSTEVSFFGDLIRAKWIILDALKITLISAFGAIIIGTIIGILIGMILTYGNKYLKIPFRQIKSLYTMNPYLLLEVFVLITIVTQPLG